MFHHFQILGVYTLSGTRRPFNEASANFRDPFTVSTEVHTTVNLTSSSRRGSLKTWKHPSAVEPVVAGRNFEGNFLENSLSAKVASNEFELTGLVGLAD